MNSDIELPSEEALLPPAEPPRGKLALHLPARHNPTLQKLVDRINADDEVYALWE